MFIYHRATHGPCHMFLWLSFSLYAIIIAMSHHVSVSPLSPSPQKQPQPHATSRTTTTHDATTHDAMTRMTNNSDTTTTTHNTRAEGLVRSRGAQTTCCLGPGMFFFCSFFFYANLYIYIHVIRPTDPPSLQEWVGGPYLCVDRLTDPPSQQERVGGLYLHSDPTLAPTWVGGHFLHYTTMDRITQSPCHSCPHHSTPWHGW